MAQVPFNNFECLREGGTAWLMAVQPRSAEVATTYRQLFDRSEDYAQRNNDEPAP